MNSEILVDVNIACYNQEAFIAQAIESVLAQKTNFKFRVLVGDDCSPDKSAQVIKQYESKFPNIIKAFYHPVNRGLGTGVETNGIFLLKKSTAKYLALLDGDDYWSDPDKLQKQVDFMESNPDHVLCFHAASILEGETVQRISNQDLGNEARSFTAIDLAKGNFLHTPTVLYRFIGFDNLPAWYKDSPIGDYVLYMFHAAHGKIGYMPDPMAVYRKHAEGEWSGLKHRQKYIRWMLVLDRLMAGPFSAEINTTLRQQKIQFVSHLFEVDLKTDVKQFDEDFKIFSSIDEQLAAYWLNKRFPGKTSSVSFSQKIKNATRNIFGGGKR